MSITEVAVEKLGFSEKSQKSANRKCLGDWKKSFVELPDAKQFLRNRGERVFQQPPDFSTSIPAGHFGLPYYTVGLLTSVSPLTPAHGAVQ